MAAGCASHLAGSAPAPAAAVAGRCGVEPGVCLLGVPAPLDEGGEAPGWRCLGLHGGADAACPLPGAAPPSASAAGAAARLGTTRPAAASRVAAAEPPAPRPVAGAEPARRPAAGAQREGGPGTVAPRTQAAIGALLAAKAQRPPAQRKITSDLLAQAAAAAASGPDARPQARDASPGAAPAAAGGVLVDIRADVTPALLDRIRDLGGAVVNSVPRYRSVRARLPAGGLEPLAELDAVQWIRTADEPLIRTQRQPSTASLGGDPVRRSADRRVDVTEGDVAHGANVARSTYGVDGTGIGVGVISDGVDTLADQQATGDVPAWVTVLPGQAGGSFPLSCGGRTSGTEGTAMLEIVHDLAPGADLFFAAGGGGPARMAQNIEDLCAAGADVIVDDIGYLGASVFQDDVIARAVSTVTANGCHYFSSAGNGGNLNDGTASVWEGDFAAGPALDLNGGGSGLVVHDFGGGVIGNEITYDSTRPIVLQWSDPAGGSANDYELFLIDADNRVLASSTNTQDGTQDPLEYILSPCSPDRRGARLVIVKNAGAEDRYLRLAYARGGLAITTAGHTFGHSASQDAIGVAAVDVADAGGAGGVFDGTESVETYSSDGPRRIFFEADGTPITPGNFSSTGGRVLQKPDLTAADGVSTSTPGFSTFRGTSAAAPHAAAIAALVLEAAGGPDNVTQDELRTAMTGRTLDIEETGVDRDAGAGIVMAPGAVDAVDVAVAVRNRAPTVAAVLADRTLEVGGAVTIDLTGAFADPDDDVLSYTAHSDDPGRLSAHAAGSTLTLTARGPGRITVRVHAADPGGYGVVQSILVTVGAGDRDYDLDDDGLIEVASLAQLDAVRYDVNGDGVVDYRSVAHWREYFQAFPDGAWDMGCPAGCIGYELTADLDFDTNASGSADAGDTWWNDGAGWLPLGEGPNPFTATFAGNGRTVSNLFIDRPEGGWCPPWLICPVGLFGVIRDGVVRDVRLLDVDVAGDMYVGGLVGISFGLEIGDSYVTGSVSGKGSVGGLVGRIDPRLNGDEPPSAITASHSTARVLGLAAGVGGGDGVGGLVGFNASTSGITASSATGDVEGIELVGGLVGFSIGPITASSATGRVKGTEDVGGLVGDIRDAITRSYATGDVEGTEGVGGLVGDGYGPITTSYATGDVEGTEGVGGLVGLGFDPITTSYATGDVEGTESVGGLVGSLHLHGSMTASYATGHVEGTRYVGGLVGYGSGSITTSYATGPARGNRYVGGLVGWDRSEPESLSANYWDMDTSGDSIGPGGRTTTELQAPTDYGGIYQTWNLDLDGDTEADSPWHFGTAAQYPALAADLDGDGEATWQEFGYQLRAGPVLTASTRAGQAVVLTWRAVDASHWSPAPEVAYTLLRDDGDMVEILARNLAGLQYADTAVTAGATYTYQVAAGVAGGGATRSALVEVVAGVANQPPLVVASRLLPDRTLELGNPEVVEVAGAFSDLDDTLTYAAASSDVAVARVSASGSRVTITPVAPGRSTIAVTATEAGGANRSVTQRFRVWVRTGDGVDYDEDDDGLIDIVTLAQLDAVRHDLLGDGVPSRWGAAAAAAHAAAFPDAGAGMGCPSGGGCTGYELEADLDFDTNGDGKVDAGDVYWASGLGWEPIAAFQGIFEGNGHTIRNLFIRRYWAGLFAVSSRVIRRAGLIDVDVRGSRAGGLVVENRGEIHASYVTGRVSGAVAGGLAGRSYDRGAITASYSTAQVTGVQRSFSRALPLRVGGLVGLSGSPIRASYATGHVSAGDGDAVGGLIGCHYDGSVVASYATGRASGVSDGGGLIGSTECSDGGVGHPVVTASYRDGSTSDHTTGSGARTTAQLQAPTGYAGIYSQWNVDLDGDGVNDAPWDFGTNTQYPALSADLDGDGNATWEEFGYQLRAGPALTATGTPRRNEVALSWTAVDASHWSPPPEVTYTVTRDDGAAITVIAEAPGRSSATDTGVVVGRAHTYQVSAVVDGGAVTHSARKRIVDGNRAPVTAETLADRMLRLEDGAADVDVAAAFSDPDNDVLTYGAVSSAPAVAGVSVSGTTVRVTPSTEGTATMTVTATDAGGSGGTATQSFRVTVNRSPVAVGALGALTLRIADGPAAVDVSGAFLDPDGDPLTYAASSSAPGVATVDMALGGAADARGPAGSTLTLTPLAAGAATVTVTATDAGGSGGTAALSFRVTVPEDYDADDDGLIEILTPGPARRDPS